ncbi:MAG TPA: hypothetical protein DC024_13215, partial [Clostridiales bacterium]|nr:hypothetical protein [Clostridiales bacterium]
TIINGTGTNQIFNILTGVVNILNLTLTNGSEYQGGAIYNSGDLTVSNCNFTGNTANIFGGAICNFGNLNVTNSTFLGNQGAYGPIRNQDGNAVFSGCIFIGNNAAYNGGVINS